MTDQKPERLFTMVHTVATELVNHFGKTLDHPVVEDITRNLTLDGVRRELLSGILKFADEHWHGFPGEDELRALLDSPADHVHEWDINAEGTATVCPCGARSSDEQAEQAAPVAQTPINYGALDPVERLAVCRGEVAPVAVVLPERMSLEKAEHHTAPVEIHNGVVTGWNACLDELKRLNGEKP